MKMKICVVAMAFLLLVLVGCSGQTGTPSSDISEPVTSSDSLASSQTPTESDSASFSAGNETPSSTESTTPEASREESTGTQTPKPQDPFTQSPEAKPQETESTPPAISETPQPPSTPTETQPSDSPVVSEEPTQPESSQAPEVTNPPAGFTQADHERIVAEVTAYAQSYKAKGFTFEWSDELEFGWETGWMGTPRINRDGVDGTIRILKYHVDLIYQTGTDPKNGVVSESVRYRVVQIEIDNEIAHAVIYG